MAKRTYEAAVSRRGDADLLALRFTVSENSEEQAKRLAQRIAQVAREEEMRTCYVPCPPFEPR